MGNRVLVIGAARSGLAGAEFLAKHGDQVILTDMKQMDHVDNLRELGVSFIWGEQPDVAAIQPDYIVISPGVPLTIPPVRVAKEGQIPVLGELELAYRHCKAPFVAITGTNGKTTTTTLTGELMKKTGRQVFVGGNIGVPLISYVEQLQENDLVVAEVSSFQLETTETFCPHLALMLNLTPDHLDRHGDMAGYLAAKAKIFANQKESDYLVLNYDDEALRGLAPQSRGKVIFFSQKHKLEEGVYLDGMQVMLALDGKQIEICRTDEIAIKGKHNLENAMGAIALAYLSGVAPEAIREVLMTFPGVEHRLEPVRTLNGVLYIN
ncbi:MAG: UDP-N-acetylmuramoyl-L-alanine--D-glutamate ligase, partial [Peptococcaceae bacterium]